MLNLRTAILTVVSFFLIFILAIAYTSIVNLGKQGILYSDYGKFYQSTQFALAGKNIYTPIFFAEKKATKTAKETTHTETKPIQLPGNLNLPLFTLLILPLGYLSYAASLWAWTLISVFLGVVSIFLVRQKIFTDHTPLQTLGLFLGFFIYYPTVATIHFGQVTLFLMPLVVGAWLATRSHQSLLAAVLLGIAAGIKPFFGLFVIYFLVRKEWQASILFVGTVLSSFVIPLLIFGKQTFLSYQATLKVVSWTASSWNASIWGIVIRLFGSNQESHIPLIPIAGLNAVLYWLLASLLLFMLIRFLRPIPNINNNQKTDLDFSITLIVMLLISPLGWIYYFPFLIVPIIALWQLAKETRYAIGLPIAIAAIIFLTSLPEPLIAPKYITYTNAGAVFFWSSAYTTALLLLLALLFRLRAHLVQTKTAKNDVTVLSPTITGIIFVIALVPSFIGVIKTIYSIAVDDNQWMAQYRVAYFGTPAENHK